MNVLLLTSHSIAEYDDLRMLSGLGYDVFSIGAYTDPANPTDDKRPALPDVAAHPDLAALVEKSREGKGDPGPLIDWAKAEIHPDILDWAETIIVHHFPEAWILMPWARLRGKRVIWRTCGQSNEWLESYMKGPRADGMQIVRYSPAERRYFEKVGQFAGEDAVIRFGKYPEDYAKWRGCDAIVVNVTQQLRQRGEATHWDYWEEATRGLPRLAVGPGSEEIGGTGNVSASRMFSILQHGRAYLYTGTQPASYTLGLMEAMLAGIPVVSIGPTWMAAPDLFEGHELTSAGFDDPRGAHSRLSELLRDRGYAAMLGTTQRARAVELFGMETIGRQWQEFLG